VDFTKIVLTKSTFSAKNAPNVWHPSSAQTRLGSLSTSLSDPLAVAMKRSGNKGRKKEGGWDRGKGGVGMKGREKGRGSCAVFQFKALHVI